MLFVAVLCYRFTTDKSSPTLPLTFFGDEFCSVGFMVRLSTVRLPHTPSGFFPKITTTENVHSAKSIQEMEPVEPLHARGTAQSSRIAIMIVAKDDLTAHRLCFLFCQETMDAFYSAATTVATQLMKGIATNLGLPRSYFAPSFEPQTSYLRLNYYPPCPEPCDSLSVNRHSDAGALTVLLQEPGSTALQVGLAVLVVRVGTRVLGLIPGIGGAAAFRVEISRGRRITVNVFCERFLSAFRFTEVDVGYIMLRFKAKRRDSGKLSCC